VGVRLVKGNDAAVIGALHAGCDAYFGYPITPASEVAHTAAKLFPRLGRVFVQAECETASINMVYGAAAAGKLAMTGSSGPGVSLMQEGMSFLAASELPCVLVDVVRAGPGLGNIGPEQSDYNQIVKGGGHGNYHNLVLAPASVQEMCDFTVWGFDLAFRYRNPVVVLADAVIGQMVEPLTLPERVVPAPDVQRWAVRGTAATRNNVVTSIFLDFEVLEDLNRRLVEKYRRARSEAVAESWQTADAEVVFVAYGVASRIARSAVEELRRAGLRAGLFRPKTLYPLPEDELAALARRPGMRLVVAELSDGQFRDDVLMATRFACPVSLLSRMGGNLFSIEDAMAAARTAAGGPA